MTCKKITQLCKRLKPGYFFSSLGLGMRLTYMENSITVPPELTAIHRLQQFFFPLLYFGVWVKGISRNPWKPFQQGFGTLHVQLVDTSWAHTCLSSLCFCISWSHTFTIPSSSFSGTVLLVSSMRRGVRGYSSPNCARTVSCL